MAERKEDARDVVPSAEPVATVEPAEEVRRVHGPGLELELRHRRDPDGAGEYLALHLRAVPDLEGWARAVRPWAALAAPWLLFTAPWLAAFTAITAVRHPALPAGGGGAKAEEA